MTKPGPAPGFVLLVAPSGSYRVAAYTKAAESLGMNILVVSNSEHSLVPEIARGVTVDFENVEAALAHILDAVSGLDIACVLATDDSCVALCSQLADHLGLPQNSSVAAANTQRKDLGREALRRAGCRHPDFEVIEIDRVDPDRLRVSFPLVIKPLGLAASRGVIRADDADQFCAAVARIAAILDQAGIDGFPRKHLLIEGYIDGPEYAFEGFMIEGELQVLTLFEKPEPLEGPFFEETYYLTPARVDAPVMHSLVDEVARCAAAYGLSHGPIHAEIRLTQDGPVLVELAARTIGGQCGQLIEFSLQQRLEEIVISGMCGHLPERADRGEAAGVLMIPIPTAGILSRVEGLTDAMRVEHVRDVEIHVSPGYELKPLPEGASYLGFIFAQGPDFDTTYAALKQAHQKLRFVTRPKWDLLPVEG
ncbi:MAG: ATP-grasp domain-containing protein [Gammaproteobacteria bacterium]|nr:ATP-grasp domain-containing protein [Gammaproteobacteria bacterium]